MQSGAGGVIGGGTEDTQGSGNGRFELIHSAHRSPSTNSVWPGFGELKLDGCKAMVTPR